MTKAKNPLKLKKSPKFRQKRENSPKNWPVGFQNFRRQGLTHLHSPKFRYFQ